MLPSDGMGMFGGLGDPDLELEAYRINPIIPFEPAKGEDPVDPNMIFEPPAANELNDTHLFNVYNFKTSSHGDEVEARLAYIGTNVEVWVEHDDPKVVVTNEMAQEIGEEFDDNIYDLITENFYEVSDVSNNGRIAILCFDIKDNYTGPGTGFVGGYFWGGDLFNQTHSNQMEIFYIDTFPGMGPDEENPDVTRVYSTLAHEFQHMVNFNRNRLKGDEEMDTWLNEALSLAAEHMYEGVQEGRINYYNQSNAIENGRSLLDWNNDEVLANYALSYLFSQYLRSQIDLENGSEHGIKFFKDIIMDDARDYTAVENVIKAHIDPDLSFGEFMTNFRAAMLLKANTGYYGFGGEIDFNEISTPLYSGGSKNIDGGGAVVIDLTESFTDPEDKGEDVKYLGVFQAD